MSSNVDIPRRLPLLVVSNGILLPGSSLRIPVKSMKNINMVKSRLLGKSTLGSTIIGVIPQEPGEEDDDFTAMHPIGTAAVVVQVTGTNWPQPAFTLLVTGLCRFKTDTLIQETPYAIARVTQLDKLPGEEAGDELKSNTELTKLAENFREQAAVLVDMLDVSIPVVARLKRILEQLPNQQVADLCASIVKASYEEKLQVLDAVDLEERLKKTLPLVIRQIEGLKVLQKTRHGAIKPSERSIVPRQIPSQMTRMTDGDEDDDERDEFADFHHKIKSVGMTKEAEALSLKELKRLKKISPQMPEHAVIRSYLELMVELPWNKMSTDSLEIERARAILDADHYGLDKVKKRIVEFLAVRQLKNSLKGPIICFVGPPGVGKTSIGRSIAKTLGREFHRIALGGVCDQSDIRGHRRTYIGSMPGRIIQGLKTVGVRNPVFLLDEVDKLGKSLQGDPSAALLEVLDPEQNHAFTDHYLNIPFDLSQVLFIATANSMSTIPAPLLDRMELIYIPGYTQEEKAQIAVRHLIPKQLQEHGLTSQQLHIPEDSVQVIISRYTREAGVRTLERKIGAINRAVAVKVAENMTRKRKQDELTADKSMKTGDDKSSAMALPPEFPIVVDEQALEDILGPPAFELEHAERLSQPGVAIGLAWTALGGEIMFVEASRMPGKGTITLTGQLGDVMKESANLALNWVRSHATLLGLGQDLVDQWDIHIHFPAGAVGKDGPSAGVTIVTVLVSLFTGRCVRSNMAMTGEITLRGLVLPVGGIKEKVLAAHRAGVEQVIMPKRCEKDLHEVPDNVKAKMSFVFVSRLEEVLNNAFDGGFPQLLNSGNTVSKL